MTDTRICYVNGDYVPASQAQISVFDRGFLLGDSVYDVAAVLDGKLVDNVAHLARLERSLHSLDIPAPVTQDEIRTIERELVARNNLSEGIVYIQVSRGAADRDFGLPKGLTPTLVMFTQAKNITSDPLAEKGTSVITTPDLRWARRDIKVTSLLAACMAKEAANAAGADDAWFVEDGTVTEGSSNNAFIVDAAGTIITRALGRDILPGITRRVVLALCERTGRAFEERMFTVAEAQGAAEAFSTSASTFVRPVIEIDGVKVAGGTPGPVTRELRALYLEFARETAE